MLSYTFSRHFFAVFRHKICFFIIFISFLIKFFYQILFIIKFPQQHINQPETRIGAVQMSVELCATV